MKKLLSAIAIAASTTAFAEYVFNYDVVTTNDFEAAALGEGTGGFAVAASEVEGATHDATAVVAYESDADKPQQTAPAASEYGNQYLALQTNDDTVWTNLTGAADTVYVDTFLKFNECGDDAEDLDEGAKTALWMSGDSLYIKGLASDGTTNNYALAAPGGDAAYYPTNWYRLTVSTKVFDGALHFNVRVNGEEVSGMPDGIVGGTATNYFRSLLNDATVVASVGFKGTGSLDNFGAASLYPMPNAYEHYFASGSGTAEDPYMADGKADAINDLIAQGLLTYEGVYFHLTSGDSDNINSPEGKVLVSKGDSTFVFEDGVAKLNGTWYASFDAAYGQAMGDGTETLLVKIDDDFAPELEASKSFTSVTFTTESTDAIAVATTNGEYAITAQTWIAPDTAELTLASQTVVSITAGTLNVPEATTLTVNAGAALAGVSSLTGTGALIAPPNPTYFYGNANTQTLLQNVAWQGVVEFSGTAYSASQFNPNLMKNSGSKIRFNGFTVGTLGATQSEYVGVELVGDGLTLNGDYTRIFTFSSIAGTGKLTVTKMANNDSYVFLRGDVSGFTGDITIAADSGACIAFADTANYSQGAIIVGAGNSVTNSEAATWTAANLIVHGELVANGTMTVSGSLWGNAGTGVYRANAATASVPTATSWNGTYVIGYELTGATDLNAYGNADSLIVFDGPTSGSAWIGSGKAAYTVNAPLRLDSNLTLLDGLAATDDSYLLTFSKLSGNGNFRTKTTNDGTGKTIRYAITELEDYAGTLYVSDKSTVTIGTVILDAEPADNVCVVDVVLGANNATINPGVWAVGETTGELEYRAFGFGGEGLYKKTSSPSEDPTYENGDGTTFTIPASVTNSLHGVVADFSATAAGKGMTYAQAYALGLLNESTGEVSDLPAVTITVGPQEISGETVNAVALQLAGSLATRGGYTVTCKVYKSASLPIPVATEPEAVTLDPTGAAAWTQATGDATAGFYQVKVTVSNAAP